MSLPSLYDRSNAGIIDDVSDGLPHVKRGNAMQYMSSIFSPVEDQSPKQLKVIMDDNTSVITTDTELRRRKKVLASYENVKQAVLKLDTSRTGNITARDLNNALEKLGIKMRKSEFRRLADDVEPNSNHRVDKPHITHLPALGRVEEEPARRRQRGIPEVGKNKQSNNEQKSMIQEASSDAWRARLEEKVSRKWKPLQRDFKQLDPERSGLVDMHTLIPSLAVHGIYLATEEADALYLQMGVGRTGKINYGEFLKTYAGKALSRTGAISAPPDLPMKNERNGAIFTVETDVQRSSLVEVYMRSTASHWRSIRQACQIMDKGLTKILSKKQFTSILHKLGVAASDQVLDAVCLRYRSFFLSFSFSLSRSRALPPSLTHSLSLCLSVSPSLSHTL
jgi:Ca2+-binding EF-hand superfamily protein